MITEVAGNNLNVAAATTSSTSRGAKPSRKLAFLVGSAFLISDLARCASTHPQPMLGAAITYPFLRLIAARWRNRKSFIATASISVVELRAISRPSGTLTLEVCWESASHFGGL